jgi:hypothetical protein
MDGGDSLFTVNGLILVEFEVAAGEFVNWRYRSSRITDEVLRNMIVGLRQEPAFTVIARRQQVGLCRRSPAS